MASKSTSGLTGTKENRQQGQENSIKAGDSPTKDGFSAHYDGPNDHIGLLEFYYGHPSSSVKNHGAPSRSQW